VYAVTWSLPGDLATVLAGLLSLGPVERGLPDYDLPPELRELLPTNTEPRWVRRPPPTRPLDRRQESLSPQGIPFGQEEDQR
jgi:hypothetical protein